jgi:hypothetical protein
MEPITDNFLENMDNLLNNISDDKEPKMNNINLLEERHNLDSDNNNSHNNDINNNNILLGSLEKATMDKTNNKDEINEFENEDEDEAYWKKPIKGDKNEKKRLGRKKREDAGSGEHNKFSDDHLRRKVKYLVLDNTFMFINEKIKKIYNGNIGHGMHIKQLLKINQNQKKDVSIQFNKDFLNKSLGEIFSEDISSRFATYHPRHNEFLIIALTHYNKDEEKKNYFKKLFSILFLDCLKHFRGSQNIEELKGLKKFENIKSKYENDKEYLKSLEYYIMHYEEIMSNKKPRKSKKAKENNNSF